MNIKKISLAVAGALLVVGCATNQPGVIKNAELRPDTDSIRPNLCQLYSTDHKAR